MKKFEIENIDKRMDLLSEDQRKAYIGMQTLLYRHMLTNSDTGNPTLLIHRIGEDTSARICGDSTETIRMIIEALPCLIENVSEIMCCSERTIRLYDGIIDYLTQFRNEYFVKNFKTHFNDFENDDVFEDDDEYDIDKSDIDALFDPAYPADGSDGYDLSDGEYFEDEQQDEFNVFDLCRLEHIKRKLLSDIQSLFDCDESESHPSELFNEEES